MKNDIQTEIISKYNYEEDSENYYKNTIQPYMNQKLLESQKDILKTLVTKNCNLKRKNYRICTDENNIPYNIDLSKVDINRFQYGEFLFYKIQLLHNIKRNMFNLITRWGRFGQVGQYQNTPFMNLEDGVKEFKKVFLSKTGNEWDKIKNNFDTFEKKNKKFNLVKLTTDQPEILNITQFFKEKMNEIKIPKIESKIENESIKNFFNFLIVNAFSSRFGNNQRINYYSRNQNYDDDEDEEYESDKKNSNFAIFKKETLNKAYEILNEIGKNINK
jgi:predicted DNA-binding WGR domain protein